MSLQDEYDELTDIIDTLDNLIDRISDDDYIDQLRETLYQAENRRQEIEPRLQREQWEDERVQEREYWEEVV